MKIQDFFYITLLLFCREVVERSSLKGKTIKEKKQDLRWPTVRLIKEKEK